MQFGLNGVNVQNHGGGKTRTCTEGKNGGFSCKQMDTLNKGYKRTCNKKHVRIDATLSSGKCDSECEMDLRQENIYHLEMEENHVLN